MRKGFLVPIGAAIAAIAPAGALAQANVSAQHAARVASARVVVHTLYALPSHVSTGTLAGSHVSHSSHSSHSSHRSHSSHTSSSGGGHFSHSSHASHSSHYSSA